VYLYLPGESSSPIKAVPPKGKEEFFTAKREIILRPGEQCTLPPDTLHWFQAGPQGAIVSEFSTKSRDPFDIYTDPRSTPASSVKHDTRIDQIRRDRPGRNSHRLHSAGSRRREIFFSNAIQAAHPRTFSRRSQNSEEEARSSAKSVTISSGAFLSRYSTMRILTHAVFV
jgi:hypothetical protein